MEKTEYIPLCFDHPTDHPYYLRGHVSIERAKEVLRFAEEITVKTVAHKYGRFVRIGPYHEDAIDGLDTVFRVIDAPRRSYYAVTECEPLLEKQGAKNGTN